MREAEHFDETIERAVAAELRDPGDPRWATARTDIIGDATRCEAFIEWARLHPKWLHNVADAADRVCAKPVEAAIFVLADIVDELLDERDDDDDDDERD